MSQLKKQNLQKKLTKYTATKSAPQKVWIPLSIGFEFTLAFLFYSANSKKLPAQTATDNTTEKGILLPLSASSLSTLHPSLVTSSAQFFSQYVSYLKSQYLSRPFPTYFKAPIILKHAKDFVNLSLVDFSIDSEQQQTSILFQIHGNVDEIHKKKKKIRIDEIGRLSDGCSAQHILIEGAPGIGKTTFCWELGRQWGTDRLLQQWSALIFVQVRDKRVREAQTLKDLLYHPEPLVSASVCQQLQETEGKGVLLLFEGYDEISASQQLSTSIFQKLLRKEVLPQAGIVVSSRPVASQTLCEHFRSQVEQHIQIIGFTRENIDTYVASACSGNGQLKEDFDWYLARHPFIFSMMYVPLYCSVITELYYTYWDKGRKEFAPKTLTSVYSSLILHLLQRHLQCPPLKSLNDLTEDIQGRLTDIARIACDGIYNHQYIFDSLDCDHMGLMQGIQDIYKKRDPVISYSFLHQTLQEFLTAFFLAHRPLNELLQILQHPSHFPIQKYLQGEHRKEADTVLHWPVLLFLAGMTKLKGLPHDLLSQFADGGSKSKVQFHPAIFQLLYETQSSSLVAAVFKKQVFAPHPWEMTPLDWFTAGHCIASSSPSSLWNLEYEHDHIHTFECLRLLGSGLNYQESGKKGGTICSFALTAGNKLLQCLEALLDLQHHIQHLSEITVGGILCAGRKGVNALESIITLCLSLTRIQISTDDSLENWSAFIDGLPQLKLLNRLELEAQFSICDAKLINVILPQCLSLTHLTLWFHEDSEGSTCLLVGIAPLVAGRLESLSIQRTPFTKETVIALAEMIESPNCSMTSFQLCEAHVSTDNFSCLAQSIAKNQSIKTLIFSECGIDDTAIICLATAIADNRFLQDIEVMEWFMSRDTEALLKECAKSKNLKVPPRNLPPEFLNLYHLNPYQ